MKEKHLWEIVHDLWEKYDCKTVIPGDILRQLIIEKTGIFDTGTTTRSLNSMLDADIIRADFGKYKYGMQGKRLLKKFGFIDDDRIDITPEFEVETNAKLKADVVVSHHADFPELPEKELAEYKKLKKKPEVDFGGTPDNAK